MHDVGKIGIPDVVLFRDGPLSPAEREIVERHAALSAEIVQEVLDAEQVDWIRAHHERPDGGGYPHGLAGDAIPEGAALLAPADAWDVMTVSRPYSHPKHPREALDECRAQVGAQFTDAAVRALEATAPQGTGAPR